MTNPARSTIGPFLYYAKEGVPFSPVGPLRLRARMRGGRAIGLPAGVLRVHGQASDMAVLSGSVGLAPLRLRGVSQHSHIQLHLQTTALDYLESINSTKTSHIN
jgi:hypothetical protein